MILDDEDVILGEETNSGIGIIPDDVEPPIDATPEEPLVVDAVVETPTDSFDWLSKFNESIGGSFTSVDEVKSKFNTTTPPEENNALKGEYDALKLKHEKLIDEYKKNTDPLGYFKDEVEVKKNILMKTNERVNGEVADKLFRIDLEKGNPLDIIALDLQLNYKSIKSGEAAIDYFKATHGIDADSFEDMTDKERLTIDIEAERAAKNIASLRDSVTVPTSRSIDDVLAEVSLQQEAPYDMTKWEGKIDNVVNSVKEVKIDVGDFTYTEAIDAEFKEGLADVIKETVAKGRIEPTQENIALLVKEAEVAYITEKFGDIARRIANQVKVKIKEEVHKTIHNDADPDKVTVVNPSSSGKTTNLLKQWGIPE